MEHDGAVYSCDHFVDPDHRLGDLARDGLAALIERPEQIAFGEAKRIGLPSCCRRCPVGRYCNGGCPKDRFVLSPQDEAGLNYLCSGYLRLYSHLRPYLERMAVLAREGRPISVISDELELAERSARAKWRAAGRNDACPCGSGRKYKHCCALTRRR